MVGAIADWVAGRSAGLTWLDSDRYVWSVFAGRPERWHSEPGLLAGANSKALPMLRSDVQEVSLAGPFGSRLTLATGADEVTEVLASEEGRRLLAETVDALDYAVGAKADLALVCPSPGRLLGGGAEADFYAMDDVAAAMLEVIRGLAGRRLAAIVIAASDPGEEELESWSTMIQATAHYGWVSAARLEGAVSSAGLAEQVQTDLVLLPAAPPGALGQGRRYGGGLVREFWGSGPAAEALAEEACSRAFLCGEVPVEEEPEAVLRRLDQLASAAGGRI